MNSVEVSQHPFVPFSSNSGLYLVSMTICWKHLQILQPTSLVARLISPSGELVPLSGTTSNPSPLAPAAHSAGFASARSHVSTATWTNAGVFCYSADWRLLRPGWSLLCHGVIEGKSVGVGRGDLLKPKSIICKAFLVHVLLRITPWSSGLCRRMKRGGTPESVHSGEDYLALNDLASLAIRLDGTLSRPCIDADGTVPFGVKDWRTF